MKQPDYAVPEWVHFPGAVYERTEGEAEILPGLRVVPTPGHTPGHQSVVIETSAGLVVIVGQAIYSAADYERLRRTGELHVDGAPTAQEPDLSSARLLIGLNPRRALFSHDPAVWNAPD